MVVSRDQQDIINHFITTGKPALPFSKSDTGYKTAVLPLD